MASGGTVGVVVGVGGMRWCVVPLAVWWARQCEGGAGVTARSCERGEGGRVRQREGGARVWARGRVGGWVRQHEGGAGVSACDRGCQWARRRQGGCARWARGEGGWARQREGGARVSVCLCARATEGGRDGMRVGVRGGQEVRVDGRDSAKGAPG